MEPMRRLKYSEVQFRCQKQTFIEKTCRGGNVVISDNNPVIFCGINLRKRIIYVVKFAAVSHWYNRNIHRMGTLRHPVNHGFDVILASWYCDAYNKHRQLRRLAETSPQSSLSLAQSQTDVEEWIDKSPEPAVLP